MQQLHQFCNQTLEIHDTNICKIFQLNYSKLFRLASMFYRCVLRFRMHAIFLVEIILFATAIYSLYLNIFTQA